jgi:hypothetical protein
VIEILPDNLYIYDNYEKEIERWKRRRERLESEKCKDDEEDE